MDSNIKKNNRVRVVVHVRQPRRWPGMSITLKSPKLGLILAHGVCSHCSVCPLCHSSQSRHAGRGETTCTEKGRGGSDGTWLRMASKPEKLPPRSASLAFSNSASLSRGISRLRSSLRLLNVGHRHVHAQSWRLTHAQHCRQTQSSAKRPTGHQVNVRQSGHAGNVRQPLPLPLRFVQNVARIGIIGIQHTALVL